LGRTGGRKRAVRGQVEPLFLRDQLVEVALRDRVAADHRDSVARNGRRAAVVTTDGQRDNGYNREEPKGMSHRKSARSRDFPQAARRASSIASTSLSASGNASSRRETSRRAVV